MIYHNGHWIVNGLAKVVLEMHAIFCQFAQEQAAKIAKAREEKAVKDALDG